MDLSTAIPEDKMSPPESPKDKRQVPEGGFDTAIPVISTISSDSVKKRGRPKLQDDEKRERKKNRETRSKDCE